MKSILLDCFASLAVFPLTVLDILMSLATLAFLLNIFIFAFNVKRFRKHTTIDKWSKPYLQETIQIVSRLC